MSTEETVASKVRDSPILSCPDELLEKIFDCIDASDLHACQQTCGVFNDVIVSSLRLTYKQELFADGLREGTRCVLDLANRLEQLREHRRRWLTLGWQQRHLIRSYEGEPTLLHAHELVGGRFFQGYDRREMVETILPTPHDQSHQDIAKRLDFTTKTITADPSQGLVVILDFEGRVHLKQMTTYEPHPLAKEPILPEPINGELLVSWLYVAGDLVASFHWTIAPGLSIWNWKTGALVIRDRGSTFPYMPVRFTFLSSRRFLLSDMQGCGTLRIYVMTDEQCTATSPISVKNLAPVANLQLPPLRETWRTFFVSADAPPLPDGVVPGRPFASIPSEGIVAISAKYMTADHALMSDSFVAFVHMQYLLSISQPGAATDLCAIPWKEWGPQHTRFMKKPVSDNAYRWHTCGQRVILPSLTESEIEVLDFNVRPLHLQIAHRPLPSKSDNATNGTAAGRLASTSADNTFKIVRTPSTVPAHGLFKEDVVTSLPYVSSTRDFSGSDTHSYMIDEDWLVQLKYTENDMQTVQSVVAYTF
ncbi:hypothetical protein WOLCODRAFT_139611 [Wolfiporia cocos MD-104 SS10]|uniref:F-box domain-containing protein n=1 Tax=Wolfiporia cocos (strain MD-104) TaxID=742152 RepID=A0A2H3IXW5_WOLCO|nr:hypothetical protein WOLCODRAFT_139611 [Wolfiporia cocos MD-104 SS10]